MDGGQILREKRIATLTTANRDPGLFPVSWIREHRFGTLVAVDYQGWKALARSFPTQLPFADTGRWGRMKPKRQATFLAGRQALAMAFQHRSQNVNFIDSGDRGQPLLPENLRGSISHKDGLAIGFAGPPLAGTLGVDLESIEPNRLHLSRRILTTEEQARLNDLPQEKRWPHLARVFSLKEALYKALYPHLQRFVGFQEVALQRHQGIWEAILGFPEAPRVQAELDSIRLDEEKILSLVRVTEA